MPFVVFTGQLTLCLHRGHWRTSVAGLSLFMWYGMVTCLSPSILFIPMRTKWIKMNASGLLTKPLFWDRSWEELTSSTETLAGKGLTSGMICGQQGWSVTIRDGQLDGQRPGSRPSEMIPLAKILLCHWAVLDCYGAGKVLNLGGFSEILSCQTQTHAIDDATKWCNLTKVTIIKQNSSPIKNQEFCLVFEQF